jgi:hypothetical protein
MAAAAAWLVVDLGSSASPRANAPTVAVRDVGQTFKACLVAPPNDHTYGPVAVQVWAGLEGVAKDGRVNAERLFATGTPAGSSDGIAGVGGRSSGAASVYVDTAISMGCSDVVAVGPSIADAIQAGAVSHPKLRFILVDATVAALNVHCLHGSAAGVSGDVRAAVTADAASGH